MHIDDHTGLDSSGDDLEAQFQKDLLKLELTPAEKEAIPLKVEEAVLVKLRLRHFGKDVPMEPMRARDSEEALLLLLKKMLPIRGSFDLYLPGVSPRNYLGEKKVVTAVTTAIHLYYQRMIFRGFSTKSGADQALVEAYLHANNKMCAYERIHPI